jgi:hypothetical protein
VPPGVIYMEERPTPEMIAALPKVEHRLEFTAYKTSDGITWPRLIVKKVQGRVTEVWQLDSIRINPRIDSRWFERAR